MKKVKQKPQKHSFIAFIFVCMLCLWSLLSVFSVLYNLQKSVSEAKQWIPLSDAQKKYLLFGDVYSFLMFIKDNTSQTTTILLYPHSEELFYRGIYDLYPRNITTATQQNLHARVQTIKPTFIATYNAVITVEGYQKIASFSGKQHNYGELYKRL